MSRRGLTRSPLSIFLAVVMVLAMSSLFGVIAQAQPAKAATTINRNWVKNLIYPTLGYPAIVRCGDEMTVEFDPRDQQWNQGLPTLTDFKASITTTNSTDLDRVTRNLELRGFKVGYSAHWPEYSQASQPKAQVYLVTFPPAGERTGASL